MKIKPKEIIEGSNTWKDKIPNENAICCIHDDMVNDSRHMIFVFSSKNKDYYLKKYIMVNLPKNAKSIMVCKNKDGVISVFFKAENSKNFIVLEEKKGIGNKKNTYFYILDREMDVDIISPKFEKVINCSFDLNEKDDESLVKPWLRNFALSSKLQVLYCKF